MISCGEPVDDFERIIRRFDARTFHLNKLARRSGGVAPMGHFSLPDLITAAYNSSAFDLRGVFLTTMCLNLAWLKRECPCLFEQPSDDTSRFGGRTRHTCCKPVPVCILHHSFSSPIHCRHRHSFGHRKQNESSPHRPVVQVVDKGTDTRDSAAAARGRYSREYFTLNTAYTALHAAQDSQADSQDSQNATRQAADGWRSAAAAVGTKTVGETAHPDKYRWRVRDVPPHVRLINTPPTLSDGTRALGVQHSKLSLLIGKHELVVVVSTSNLGEQKTLDMSWIQRFPLRTSCEQRLSCEDVGSPGAGSPAKMSASGHGTDFGAQLDNFLAQLQRSMVFNACGPHGQRGRPGQMIGDVRQQLENFAWAHASAWGAQLRAQPLQTSIPQCADTCSSLSDQTAVLHLPAPHSADICAATLALCDDLLLHAEVERGAGNVDGCESGSKGAVDCPRSSGDRVITVRASGASGASIMGAVVSARVARGGARCLEQWFEHVVPQAPGLPPSAWLGAYDFSKASADLVATVPGEATASQLQRGRFTYGAERVAEILRHRAAAPPQSAPLIMQPTSIGNGCDSQYMAWLVDRYTSAQTSAQAGDASCDGVCKCERDVEIEEEDTVTDALDTVPLRLIWPSVCMVDRCMRAEKRLLEHETAVRDKLLSSRRTATNSAHSATRATIDRDNTDDRSDINVDDVLQSTEEAHADDHAAAQEGLGTVASRIVRHEGNPASGAAHFHAEPELHSGGLFFTPEFFEAMGHERYDVMHCFDALPNASYQLCKTRDKENAVSQVMPIVTTLSDVVPHVKTYLRLAQPDVTGARGTDVELAWVMLSSACLSRGAQGFWDTGIPPYWCGPTSAQSRSRTQTQRTQSKFVTRNFELGVMLRPDLQRNTRWQARAAACVSGSKGYDWSEGSVHVTDNDLLVRVPIPYSLPPQSYCSKSLSTRRMQKSGGMGSFVRPFFNDRARFHWYHWPWESEDAAVATIGRQCGEDSTERAKKMMVPAPRKFIDTVQSLSTTDVRPASRTKRPANCIANSGWNRHSSESMPNAGTIWGGLTYSEWYAKFCAEVEIKQQPNRRQRLNIDRN